MATFDQYITPDYATSGQFDFFAIFPRYAEKDQEMLEELLGSHVPQSDLPLDTCRAPEPVLKEPHHATSTQKQTISLLDAGNMTLNRGSGRLPVLTRTFPDLLKVIDGVIYSGTPKKYMNFLPGQAHTIKTVGTDEIGAFEVVLEAPEDLGTIRVNAVDPAEKVPGILRGKPIAITWQGEGYGDEIITTVRWVNMGIEWWATCRMKDDGQFNVPPDITEQMQSDSNTQLPEISLSRVRQVSFAARGISFGDFSFVATNTFTVKFP